MSDCNPTATPLKPGQILQKHNNPVTAEEEAEMKRIPYHEAVGSINYLATGTRPDLTYAVHILSWHLANTQIEHWKVAKGVMRYIKGTLNYGITYYAARHPKSTIEPVIHSDASYTNCLKSAQSTQGYVMTLAGGPVAWSTKKQDVVALSTTEAEYITLVHTGQTAVWARKLLYNIKLPVTGPTLIYTDSSGAESLATRSANFTKVRHLRTRYHWLHDTV